MRAINKIIIHCSATPPSMNIGAEEIRQWHTWPKEVGIGKLRYQGKTYNYEDELPEHVRGKRGNGWRGIGYHYVIRRDGGVEDGRPLDTAGAHAKGHNENSIGICMVGGVDKDNKPQSSFTKKQWATLDPLVRNLVDDYPEAEVLGHRDLPGVTKACPSFDAISWWNGIHS